MAEVAVGRAGVGDFLGREVRGDGGLLGEILGEAAALAPGFHRGALNGFVGGFALHAFFREHEQRGLARVETAGEFHVSPHVFGIDEELRDELGQ